MQTWSVHPLRFTVLEKKASPHVCSTIVVFACRFSMLKLHEIFSLILSFFLNSVIHFYHLTYTFLVVFTSFLWLTLEICWEETFLIELLNRLRTKQEKVTFGIQRNPLDSKCGFLLFWLFDSWWSLTLPIQAQNNLKISD